MKTATLPPIRVEPEFREQLEGALKEGETLTTFIEDAIRERMRRRHVDAEFHARGLKALAEWRVTGESTPAAEVIEKLEAKLAAARAELARRRSAK